MERGACQILVLSMVVVVVFYMAKVGFGLRGVQNLGFEHGFGSVFLVSCV